MSLFLKIKLYFQSNVAHLHVVSLCMSQLCTFCSVCFLVFPPRVSSSPFTAVLHLLRLKICFTCGLLLQRKQENEARKAQPDIMSIIYLLFLSIQAHIDFDSFQLIVAEL